MYRAGISKAQRPERSLLKVYRDPGVETAGKSQYKFISIDPALKNFAIRVELRPVREGEGRWDVLLYERVALQAHQEKQRIVDCINALSEYLERHRALFADADVVLIEEQMAENYKCVRISQHALTWFLTAPETRNATVCEVSPMLKGRQLGAVSGWPQKQLKAWAVERATALFTERGDSKSLALLAKQKKKDDLADTVCQIEAFFRYCEW